MLTQMEIMLDWLFLSLMGMNLTSWAKILWLISHQTGLLVPKSVSSSRNLSWNTLETFSTNSYLIAHELQLFIIESGENNDWIHFPMLTLFATSYKNWWEFLKTLQRFLLNLSLSIFEFAQESFQGTNKFNEVCIPSLTWRVYSATQKCQLNRHSGLPIFLHSSRLKI